jgi:hypothetical protein
MEVIMVAATYGNYNFKDENRSLALMEGFASKEYRMQRVNEGTSLSAMIRGRRVGITGRRPAGLKNRAEFEEFVDNNGGFFDNNPNHWDNMTLVIGDKNSPSAKMRRAKMVNAIIVPADKL